MSESANVLMVGVGGQGIILASEIFGHAAYLAGFDVKKSDVHGMAQRGGSVSSHLRFGQKVFSPLIPDGEVDFLFSTELLEGMRYTNQLRKNGRIIQSLTRIFPPTVTRGDQKYPENIEDDLKKFDSKTLFINNFVIAKEVGNIKCATVVLLGAFSTLLPINEGHWKEAVEYIVPKKILEINLKAFEAGRQAANS